MIVILFHRIDVQSSQFKTIPFFTGNSTADHAFHLNLSGFDQKEKPPVIPGTYLRIRLNVAYSTIREQSPKTAGSHGQKWDTVTTMRVH